ncbi:MAG: hypothetical protein ACLRFL_02845 [Clostridia bacterium]
MTKLFSKLIEKHKEKEYNKPKYPIKKLYIGAIGKITKREYVGLLMFDNHYERVKDFAIFYKLNEYDYIHIKSGQKLTIIDRATIGDYCIVGLKSFAKAYPIQMREAGDTEKTKYSKAFIDQLETAQNIEWAHGPIKEHNLFGA